MKILKNQHQMTFRSFKCAVGNNLVLNDQTYVPKIPVHSFSLMHLNSYDLYIKTTKFNYTQSIIYSLSSYQNFE